MYTDMEIQLSQEHLAEIVHGLEQPFCLIGGWAVYFTVNDNYKKATGKDYFGSKDIDLGFPIGKNWTEQDIKNSNLAKAMKILEKNGFERVGWALRKYYHISKKKFISVAEQKEIPFHDLAMLQVDLIVERNPVKVKQALNSFFFEEEILAQVFEQNKKIRVKAGKEPLFVALPEVLIATKIKAMPNRTKDHKKVKDLYDLYALIQFAAEPAEKLIEKTKQIVTKELIQTAVHSISKKEQETIEKELGTPIERQNQINQLLLK